MVFFFWVGHQYNFRSDWLAVVKGKAIFNRFIFYRDCKSRDPQFAKCRRDFFINSYTTIRHIARSLVKPLEVFATASKAWSLHLSLSNSI